MLPYARGIHYKLGFFIFFYFLKQAQAVDENCFLKAGFRICKDSVQSV